MQIIAPKEQPVRYFILYIGKYLEKKVRAPKVAIPLLPPELIIN
jgi:hypothetical protein